MSIKDEYKGQTFEDAMKELENIVYELEHNDLSLERSFTLYNRGRDLYEYCQKTIESISLKIEDIN